MLSTLWYLLAAALALIELSCGDLSRLEGACRAKVVHRLTARIEWYPTSKARTACKRSFWRACFGQCQAGSGLQCPQRLVLPRRTAESIQGFFLLFLIIKQRLYVPECVLSNNLLASVS